MENAGRMDLRALHFFGKTHASATSFLASYAKNRLSTEGLKASNHHTPPFPSPWNLMPLRGMGQSLAGRKGYAKRIHWHSLCDLAPFPAGRQ